MEKLTGLLSQEYARRLFKSSLKYNWIFELQRMLLSDGLRSKIVESAILKVASDWGVPFNNLALFQSGRLLRHHKTVSVSLDFRNSKFETDFEIGVVSGSGDGFSEKDAKGLALLELLDRFSYYFGKYYFLFRFGFSLYNRDDFEEIKRPYSTTGFALEATPQRAIARGLLEAIERDAYLCHWYTNTPPQEITLCSDSVYQAMLSGCEGLGLTLRVFLLRSDFDGVYVVLSTVYDQTGNTGTTFFCSGLAADFSIRRAFLKSYFELDRFIRVGFRNLGKNYPTTDLSRPMGRFFFYLNRNKMPDLEVFTSGGNPMPLDSTTMDKEVYRSHSSFVMTAINHPLTSLAKIYPGPMIKPLSKYFFTCWVDVPKLTPLCYEWPPVVNESRLQEFSKTFEVSKVKPHPLP